LIGAVGNTARRSRKSTFTDDDFRASIQQDVGIEPGCAAEACSDVDDDVRQSIARIKASPFVPRRDQVRGFVYDVAKGELREISEVS
jgi:carbonic anhydrase